MMNRYEKYKPSGFDWIGGIPEHWEVKKLSYCFKIIGSGTTPKSSNLEYYNNGIYNWLQTGDLSNNEIHNTSRQITQKAIDDYSTLRFYPEDSLVIAMYGATIGKTGILKIKSTTNQACCVLSEPKSIISKYVFYWFNSIKKHIVSMSYGGGQPNVNQEMIRFLKIQFPPIKEQTAIANYLDRKTAEIDELIKQKEQLLELYDEEKTAIINQLVTGKIIWNGNAWTAPAEVKDSGEWLGEIPEHWEVKKLKHVIIDKLKYGANETAIFENKKDPRYIRITDFRNDGNLRENTFKSLPPEIANEYLLQEGDILFARSGATVGKTFHFKNYIGKACFAGYLIKATPNKNLICSDFLYLYTKTTFYERWKESIFNKATIQNIGADKYAFLDIPLPSLPEQTAIVQYIEAELNRINAKAEKTKKLIELLKEYKQALISEVVTGKIKVV